MTSLRGTALVLIALSLLGCAGEEEAPYVADKNVPIQSPTRLDSWKVDMEQKLSGASDALERAKGAVSGISPKGRAEHVAAIEGAQDAIRDVSARQEQVREQYMIAFAALQIAADENRKLATEKAELEVRQRDLEQREKIWTVGFFTTLGVLVVSLAALIPKLATFRLDRQYRKLEVEQKRLEIARLQGNQPPTQTSGAVAPTSPIAVPS